MNSQKDPGGPPIPHSTSIPIVLPVLQLPIIEYVQVHLQELYTWLTYSLPNSDHHDIYTSILEKF